MRGLIQSEMKNKDKDRDRDRDKDTGLSEGLRMELAMLQVHTFEPVYDKDSRILILGSFPSVKSREQNFYYGHPQNRFWKVIAALMEEPVPKMIAEKRQLLLSHHIALWDVIYSCEIVGSSDSSIKNVTPNEIARICGESQIRQIYANGNTAGRLYQKHIGENVIILPSTSPANAAFSLDRLIECWKVIQKGHTER